MSNKVKVYTVRAFSMNGEGGSPAGVVLSAQSLTPTEMQRVAHRVGYSETAFVMESGDAGRRVRFFTPEKEVGLCAHATIATYHQLVQEELLQPGTSTMQTEVGIQEVTYTTNGLVSMTQNAPNFGDTIEARVIAPSLGLEASDLSSALPLRTASTGLWKIFAPVRDLDALARVQFNYDQVAEVSRQYGAIGIYVYCVQEDGIIRTRNAAPVVGIREDAATGTSAAALTCLLYEHNVITAQRAQRVQVHQGVEIRSPSEIIVRLETDGKRIDKVHVAGRAYTIGYQIINARSQR